MACVQSVLCSIIEQLQETTTPKRLSELDELDRPSVQSRTKEIVSQAYKFGFEVRIHIVYLIFCIPVVFFFLNNVTLCNSQKSHSSTPSIALLNLDHYWKKIAYD